MNPLGGLIQRFGLGRLIAILGGAAGVAAALAAVFMNLGGQPKALLYSNLDLKEAGSITQALDQAGVKYEVKGDGSTILVPRDEVASARLMLSGKGLPTSGSVGYEIFDNAPALGQTDFVQNLNRQRALEGELARTVRSLQGVTSARVHLVLPRRQLFEDEAEQPSASVVIGVGRDPSGEEVRAIRNLVAGAVPGLKPDRVTVVDDKGKMLAAGDGGENGMNDQLAADQRLAAEERIRKTVKDLVEGVVGPGKARVTVSADVEMSRVTVQEEKYDPDGQVVRSTQSVQENSAEKRAGAGGAATAAANIPGAAAEENGQDGSNSGRTEETTNYEISRSTRTEVQEPGAIKRLSVAVAVDGVTTFGEKNKINYAPRSAEEMQRIESLVRSAVGFQQNRGDQITVVNVRFSQGDVAEAGVTAGSPLMGFDKNDIMRGVEILILAIVAALVIFFVARPLLKNAQGGGPVALLASAAGGQGGPAPTPLTMVQGGGDGQLALPSAGSADMDARLDIAKIEGQVKVSSVKRVSEFVEQHPDESVSILRSWLHETA